MLTKKRQMKTSLEDLKNDIVSPFPEMVVKIKKYRVFIDGKDILNQQKNILKRKIFFNSVEGYSYEELAEKYDLSVSDVRNYVFQTRKKIRKAINQ
jgi:DNA-directed RNA polymerase specialized sigma24 family protein